MSEREDLERQLDAAFASTRPRRGFEDELWARLQRRTPWWRRLPALRSAVPWQAVTAGATVLVVGLAAFGLSRLHTGGGMGAAGPALSRGGSVSAPQAGAGEQFGAVPRPPANDSAAAASGRAAALAPISPGASIPPAPLRMNVYRYLAQRGPAPGTIVELDRVPQGLDSASYPTRSPLEAVRDAGVAPASAVTGIRLVYLAVADGDHVYLEPVYLLTVDGATQVVVPAVSSSSIR